MAVNASGRYRCPADVHRMSALMTRGLQPTHRMLEGYGKLLMPLFSSPAVLSHPASDVRFFRLLIWRAA